MKNMAWRNALLEPHMGANGKMDGAHELVRYLIEAWTELDELKDELENINGLMGDT